MAIKKTTISIREMREMLGLKKTESYWLVHRDYFKTILVNGKMRVDIESFEKWYANQVKHKKVDGPPPGAELRKMSYSPQEIAEILHISDSSVYYLINRDHIPTFKVDTWIRIKKTDFRAWYYSQNKHRMDDDRMQDRYWEERSLSMPEAARELGIPRNKVYQIFKAKKNQEKFVFLNIGDQRRVTRKSFDEWYQGQREYLKPEDRPSYQEKKKEQLRIKKEQDREELDMNKDSYTVYEAALILNMNYKTLARWIQLGKVKATKFGRIIRIEKSELERLIWDTPAGKTEEGSE